MTQAYPDPVRTLLTYGGLDTKRLNEPWPDYLALGLTPEHVSDLIRMATDGDLHNAPGKSLEVWAPLHAWRALAQLRAVEAAEPLVLLFEELKDDDWLSGEFPIVFSMIGPATIPILEAFLGNDGVEDICRISVPACLERIAQDHPSHRDDCIGVLVWQLEKIDSNGPLLNAFLILSLVELGATDTIGAIRQAFLGDQVDLSVLGDVEDVEMELGLRTSRSTPPPRIDLFGSSPDFHGLLAGRYSDQAFRNPQIKRAAKVGRNAPCPCGSGKKFKKCCLN